MDAELLKRGCEAAGFEQEDYAALGVKDVTREGFVWGIEDPALPAYVASLLVERVRERGAGTLLTYMKILENVIRNDEHVGITCWRIAGATDEQRIRAALDVLEGE